MLSCTYPELQPHTLQQKMCIITVKKSDLYSRKRKKKKQNFSYCTYPKITYVAMTYTEQRKERGGGGGGGGEEREREREKKNNNKKLR